MKENRFKSILLYVFLTFFLLAAQSLQSFAIGGVYPDFMMLLIVIFSFSRKGFYGQIFGFGLGILFDMMSSVLIGLNAFIFTALGAFVDVFKRLVKLPNIIVFIFYVGMATIFKYVLYHIFFIIYLQTSLFDLYYLLKIPGEILYNIIAGFILYLFISYIDVRDDYEWF